MPKIFKARLTDAPLPLNPRSMIITDSKKPCACPVPKKVITRDSGMARRTHVATYFGEYSSLRSVDNLEIYDNSNDSQPPKLVCVYMGTAFVAENGSDEVKIFLISSESVGVNTLGDSKNKHTGMNAKRYMSEVVLKARRKQCGAL
jgi:hypothetical protein